MRTARRRPVLAAITALALTVPLAATLTPAAAEQIAALPTVVINEVESSGGAPVDWIEITNTGAAPVDVSGWILRDDKNTSTVTIPAGSVLAAGGFLAMDVDVDGGFGLGGADSARLFAADGTTLVDSYSWTAHAATTYGRVPDGTGAFVVTAASSKGAPNVAAAPAVPSVRINEVESSGGSPVDWIEIVNTGTGAADVSGWLLKDSDDTHTLAIAPGTTLAAGELLAIDVDVTGGFGLGGADAARLFLADGTTLVDSYSWTVHAPGTSYGRIPDGTGAFVLTSAATKGTANAADAPAAPAIRINEVESNGGTPGDWVELFNSGTTAFDLGGYLFKDSDDTHAFYAFPAGTSVPAGGYHVIEESDFVWGLGTADSARLFAPDGVTLVDSRSWTAHSPTTLGVCGTDFVVTTSSTKGAVNDCSAPVRINEIESQDGTPGDWIELRNNGVVSADISGLVLKDNSDKTPFTVPAGTTVAAGGYFVADLGDYFGLGGADSVRLFAADGTTLIDSFTWTAHATTTYGRCVDGTGEFATTASSTKGAANDCVGDLVTSPWPGSPEVATADAAGTFASNMSGLAYEAAATGDVLWAARNGVGALFRLVFDGTNWVPDTANGWGAGKELHYADGTGDVDAEGVAFTAAGSASGVFIASERNNGGGGSRLSVLRYDPAAAGSSLNAGMEWNLNADLPVVGANLGLEGIAWVPDSYLVGGGLVDESTGAAYDPAAYADHGDGLFFVALEANGTVYGYALNQATGGYTRVVTVESGFPSVMELEYDAENQQLWALCDDTCQGRSAILDISAAGAFEVGTVYERPAGLANLNNEGFALAPQAQCVDGAKAAFWSDDSSTGGFAIRVGAIDCTVAGVPSVPTVPGAPTVPSVPTVPTGSGATGVAGQRLASTGADLGAPVATALLLLLAGAGLLVQRRRRTAA